MHHPKRWPRLARFAALVLAVAVISGVAWATLRGEPNGSGNALAETLAAAWRDPAVAQRLPVQALDVDSATPAPTLQEAAAKATLIVHGRVTGVEFKAGNPGVNTFVTLRVDDVLKGDDALASSDITVVQPGGPVNYPDEHGVVATQLLQFPADPILFPGAEAVLFLAPDSNEHGAFWSAWPTTSQYRVVDGVVQAVEGNPFASEVDGLSPDAFMDAVRHVTAAR